MQNASERKQLKVLVVDDTSTNRQILKVFLSRLNVLVITADDGAEGVAAFEREQPDLVIMDVMMPVMDGYEATRRIKALAGERWAPVIFLSALDKEENLVAGLDAGGDDYLHKPVNFVVLAAKIRSIGRALAMQRALYDERQRIAAITDNLVDGVVTIDDKGIIQWCNPAVESIFGYTQQEMIGNNVNMLMPEPHRSQHDAYMLRYLHGGMPRVLGVGQRNMQGVRRGGEIFPLDLGISEMRVAGSRQFVGVIRDTTEREAAAAQLRENADRLQRYHDAQEAESALAQKIVSRQMQREGLQDAAVSYWLGPNANFSGDVVAATRDAAGNLYVLLADATGHGLGAAICTLPVLSLFYSLSQTGTALAEIVQEVNRQLRATLPVGYFVAIAMLRLQADGRCADVWLGGVPDMLLLGESGQLKRRFSSANLPLGIDHIELSEIAVERVEVREDDQLILFSDGLIEAANAQGNPFGYDLLISSLVAAPAQRVEAVREALTRHLAGCAAHDDISMMAISCAPYAQTG